MPRLFLALRVPPTAELERVLQTLRDVRGVAAVRRENLHYTLRFLGHVDDAIKQGLLAVLHDAHVDVRPFPIPIRGTSAFPNGQKPRVVWAGCSDDAGGGLRRVADAADAFARECGLEARDKPFVPHLTLARVKVSGGRGMDVAKEVVAAERETDFGTAEARRVHLVESQLTPQGPVYKDIAEVPLR